MGIYHARFFLSAWDVHTAMSIIIYVRSYTKYKYVYYQVVLIVVVYY